MLATSAFILVGRHEQYLRVEPRDERIERANDLLFLACSDGNVDHRLSIRNLISHT